MALYLSSSAPTPVHTIIPISRGCFIMSVTPCRVTMLLRAQARLYAEALSLYTPHNGTQVHTVAYRGAVEYVVSIIAVA